MAQQKSITDRGLEEVRGSPDDVFETLVRRCPEFAWGEVLHEVARLSRMGQVRIVMGSGLFTITPQLEGHIVKTAVRRRTEPRESTASTRSDH
jgi:hypothetical protein